MRRWRDQRGAGFLGCLFTLLLAVAFLYICFKIVPVYYHSSEFQSKVELEVDRAGAKYRGDDLLRRSIMNEAAVQQIPLKPENIRIVRSSSEIAVEVNFDVPVDFSFYRHVFRFDYRFKSLLGSL